NDMIQKCGDGNHYRPHRRLRARAPALGSARWSARLEIVRLGCDGTIARERPDLGPRGARQIRGADGRGIGKGRCFGTCSRRTRKQGRPWTACDLLARIEVMAIPIGSRMVKRPITERTIRALATPESFAQRKSNASEVTAAST